MLRIEVLEAKFNADADNVVGAVEEVVAFYQCLRLGRAHVCSDGGGLFGRDESVGSGHAYDVFQRAANAVVVGLRLARAVVERFEVGGVDGDALVDFVFSTQSERVAAGDERYVGDVSLVLAGLSSGSGNAMEPSLNVYLCPVLLVRSILFEPFILTTS